MRAVIRCHLLVITAVLLGSVGGCATPPPADDPDAVADFKETNDPIEPTNRVMYAFNNGIDTVLLRPAAKAYRFILPGPVRSGIHNALSNLGTPVTLGNPNSPAGRAYFEAARRLKGETLVVTVPAERKSIMGRLFGRRAVA